MFIEGRNLTPVMLTGSLFVFCLQKGLSTFRKEVANTDEVNLYYWFITISLHLWEKSSVPVPSAELIQPHKNNCIFPSGRAKPYSE